eukprot:2321663-Prymnesium_polylepis.1
MGVGPMRDVTHPCHLYGLCDPVLYSCKGDPSILPLSLPPSPLLTISLPPPLTQSPPRRSMDHSSSMLSARGACRHVM